MPAGIGSLWPAEVGTRWTRHDWGRGDGRGEESGTHRRDRLHCSIYAHAARYSGAVRHPNSLSGWHSKLHNILLPNKDILSWTGPCNTPGPCNTRLIQPITINFSHSFRYMYKLYTAIIFSVKFETLLNVSIEDIVNSRTHLVWISKIFNFFALCLSISETK